LLGRFRQVLLGVDDRHRECRISEIRRQRQLIVTKARAQQEELHPVYQQFETGQIARVMIE
jgi:hypothetical protein